MLALYYTVISRFRNPSFGTTVVATSRANQDPSAPWSIPSNLCGMGALWEKNVLPSQWNISAASLSKAEEVEYLEATYLWVQDNFDGKKTHHRLGLVIAIMFSQLLPNIGYPKTPGTNISFDLTSDILTRKIRDVEWILPSHKGVSQREPFITMMSTAIIALLDSGSPFRRYLANNNNTFGAPWTDKHGAKCMTPFNFICIGIAKAISHSVMTRP
ncbi:hypothetical protein BYT27DRAFT_7259216 [Phlegmacium glaucopus]|nr:hypothetical protein BYT27DRAFT_7259216 [Phlegmacium glaucopus]